MVYSKFFYCANLLAPFPITSYPYSSKILYDYKLKGKFIHKELFCGKEFKCKVTKSGNVHCKFFTQTIWPDIESERKLTQLYEDDSTIIYKIEDFGILSENDIGKIYYYCILVKLKKEGGLILPGVYITFFDKLYIQKFIFDKKNTRASKNKFPKLSKYLHHVQPIGSFVKLLIEKEKKLRLPGRKRFYLRDLLKFSKYIKIGSLFYAKEGIDVSESFNFNRVNLPYDSTWFDFSLELENFCCFLYAWLYVHVNSKFTSFGEFADCNFINNKNYFFTNSK